jgi:hypothetical protein
VKELIEREKRQMQGIANHEEQEDFQKTIAQRARERMVLDPSPFRDYRKGEAGHEQEDGRGKPTNSVIEAKRFGGPGVDTQHRVHAVAKYHHDHGDAAHDVDEMYALGMLLHYKKKSRT